MAHFPGHSLKRKSFAVPAFRKACAFAANLSRAKVAIGSFRALSEDVRRSAAQRKVLELTPA